MNQNNYCIIMAGGIGSRFWPLSKTARPKQFLDILGTGRTLLQQTYDRFRKIMNPENILVVTNSIYEDLVAEQLPELPVSNILGEPYRRNTAPCIAYGSYKIMQNNPNANIVVAPSDHLILKESEFLDVISKGIEFISTSDNLLTIGIKPSRPETGYGYIQINNKNKENSSEFNKVKTFTEKPDLKMAQVFFESGEFFWNSGIFLWSGRSIIKSLEDFLPEVAGLFSSGSGKYNTTEEKSYIEQIYPVCKNISIDYGVMEKAKNVFVLCADFGWSDLGTWGSLYEHSEKDSNNNALKGEDIFLYDTRNCVVNISKNKSVVIQGLKDYIVAESDDVILVCKLSEEQLIRQFVHDVKLKKGEEFV